MNIFVDTNVLLDVLTQRAPFYDDAAVVWSLVEQGIVSGSISAMSVNNVFYIARKLKTLDYAQGLVDKLLKISLPSKAGVRISLPATKRISHKPVSIYSSPKNFSPYLSANKRAVNAQRPKWIEAL